MQVLATATTPPPRTRSSPSHALLPTISSAEIADEIADEIAPRGDLVYYLADEIAPPLRVEVEEAKPPPPLPPSSLLGSISHVLLKIPLHGDEDADDEYSRLLAAAVPDVSRGGLEYLEEGREVTHASARQDGARALGAPVLPTAPSMTAPVTALCNAPSMAAPVTALCNAPSMAAPVTALCNAPSMAAPVTALCNAPSMTAPVTALCNLLRRLEPRGAESGDALLPWLQAELAIAAAMGGEGIAQQAQLEVVMHVLEPIIKEPTTAPRPPPLIAAAIKEPTTAPRPPPLIAAAIKEPTDTAAAASSLPPDERTTAVDAVSSATTSPITTAVSAASSAPGFVVSAVSSAPGFVVSAVSSAPGFVVSAVSSAPGFVVIPVMGRVFGAPSISGEIWSDETAAEVPGDYGGGGGGGGGGSCSGGSGGGGGGGACCSSSSPAAADRKGTLESLFGAMAASGAKSAHGQCSVQRAVERSVQRSDSERALLGAVLGEIRAKRAALLQRARKRESCALAVAELAAAKTRATRHCGLLNHELNAKRLCRVVASEEMRAPLTRFQRQGRAGAGNSSGAVGQGRAGAGNSSGAAAERLASAAAVLETLTVQLQSAPALPKKEAIDGLQRLLWRLAYVAARSATARNQQDVALLESCARLRQGSAQHGAVYRPPASLGVPVEHEHCVELMGLIRRQLRRLQEERTIEVKAQLVTECWRLIFLGARHDARSTPLRLSSEGARLPNLGVRPAAAGALSDESGDAAVNPHATGADCGGGGRREEMSAAPSAAARWVVDTVSTLELDEASMADLLPTAAWTLIHATSSTLLSDLQLVLEMRPPDLQKAPTTPLMATDCR